MNGHAATRTTCEPRHGLEPSSLSCAERKRRAGLARALRFGVRRPVDDAVLGAPFLDALGGGRGLDQLSSPSFSKMNRQRCSLTKSSQVSSSHASGGFIWGSRPAGRSVPIAASDAGILSLEADLLEIAAHWHAKSVVSGGGGEAPLAAEERTPSRRRRGRPRSGGEDAFAHCALRGKANDVVPAETSR